MPRWSSVMGRVRASGFTEPHVSAPAIHPDRFYLALPLQSFERGMNCEQQIWPRWKSGALQKRSNCRWPQPFISLQQLPDGNGPTVCRAESGGEGGLHLHSIPVKQPTDGFHAPID